MEMNDIYQMIWHLNSSSPRPKAAQDKNCSTLRSSCLFIGDSQKAAGVMYYAYHVGKMNEMVSCYSAPQHRVCIALPETKNLSTATSFTSEVIGTKDFRISTTFNVTLRLSSIICLL